jgi:hypothetical protein
MMGEPPVYPGTKATPSDVPSPPGVIDVMVGAPGNALGVPLAGDEFRPFPAELTARRRTEYVVPFVRPLIVSGDDVTPPDTHVVPPSNEY